MLLGYVGGDYTADDMLNQFVQQRDTLLIGTVLLQLRVGDGTPVGVTGSTLQFTLAPADAALLAPDGDLTQISASTFDANLGSMRRLQQSTVVRDDGSVSLSVGPGFVAEDSDVETTQDVTTQDAAVTPDEPSADGTDAATVESVDPTEAQAQEPV